MLIRYLNTTKTNMFTLKETTIYSYTINVTGAMQNYVILCFIKGSQNKSDNECFIHGFTFEGIMEDSVSKAD